MVLHMMFAYLTFLLLLQMNGRKLQWDIQALQELLPVLSLLEEIRCMLLMLVIQ